MEMNHPALNWLWHTWLAAIPKAAISSVVEWARVYVKLVGSARSESYDPDITPWTKEPIECANDGTRKMTFVKPIQAGGSAVGEIAILYWLSNWNGGDVQYNWQNDLAADERWVKHMEKKIRACVPVMERTSPDRFKFTKGLVIFPHCNFIQQGVFTDRSVASDSIRGQVNEEIHDEESGWHPGRLEQCYGRTTAFWNSVIFNISNAGKKGGQLHQALTSGTLQRWQVKCPGCSNPHHEANSVFHTMRTEWDEKQPHLGGLRYNADGCRLDGNVYNYSKLAPTIRFQMPCGYIVHEDQIERRSLSLSGNYSEPTNPGALRSERSYTLEAVSVDYIPWIELIRQKHLALRAMKLGDPEPWFTYLRERECRFISLEDRPTTQAAIVLSSRNKDREGIPNRAARFGILDYQKGEGDELPHWWLLIQDWADNGDSLIVWEGRCVTDTEAVDTLNRHGVQPIFVVVDSGYNADHVYAFCLKHGFNCLKVEGKSSLPHEDGSRHTWSEEVPLHVLLGLEPTQDDPEKEPFFWRCCKWGAMERLGYVRGCRKYEVPADVSQSFLDHMAAWTLKRRKVPRTGEEVIEWEQIKKHDHLYQCAVYGCQMAEMFGLVGLGSLPLPTDTTEEKPDANEQVDHT